MIKEGDRAPDFTLRGIDEDGNERVFSLRDFRGRRLVLYFYPRDNTPGCTQEACDFRDNLNRLTEERVVVLGLSPDSVESHRRFRKKHGIHFPLLSDPERYVAETYGAFGEKKLYGKTTRGVIRSTFLIDGDGKIVRVWRNVKVKGHVEDVLASIKDLID